VTIADPRAYIDSKMTEKEFQSQVLELAEATGWLCYHTYNSQRSQAGFPDLVLVRGHRLIFAELKREKGRLSESQRTWLAALEETAETHVWRPSDWDTVIEVLT
jgi:hypothetical protein